MFRENSKHLQKNMLETVNWMDESLKNKLEKTWAPIFYEYVFCKIDEKPFHVLYSGVGRPNAPVNVLLSLEFIKHMFDYSDDHLILEYNFNYLVSYAIGYRVLGSDNIGERTLYDFRERLYKYMIEHPQDVNLVFDQFQNLFKEFVKVSGINIDEQRMDSTAVMPNIAKAGRLGLTYSVMKNALKVIPENILTDTLKEASTADFKKEVLYKIKSSETDKKIEILIKICGDILEIVNNTTHIDLHKANEIKVLKRFLVEQTNFDKGSKKYVLKDKKDITSESLQSAYDEEATYRKKAGKGESGYTVNIAETCSKENELQLITDYELDKNTKSDVSYIKERLPVIKELTGCKELTVDGAYYCEEVVKDTETKIHLTDMTGKTPSKDVSKFDIDKKEDVIVTCPAGINPFDSKKNESVYIAHFDIEACKKCELKDKCPVILQKKTAVVRITEKSINAAKTRNDINENQTVNSSNRAAIEGTNSELKRMHGMKKLRVRGKNKSSIVVGFKIIACNIKRFSKYILKLKYEKFDISYSAG